MPATPTVRGRLPMLGGRVAMATGRAPTMQPGSWRTNEQSSSQRGYDYRWQKARAAYLRLHPYCIYCMRDASIRSTSVAEVIVECAERGLPVPYGNVVDHIEAHRGDKALFWDESNWQTLCRTHHSGQKQREEAGSGF
ncbi:HNH endonuclease signature motif containing protein [Cupriavidus pampae]